jgi:hypothetical protein
MPADNRKMIDIPPHALCPHEVTVQSGLGVIIDAHGVDQSDETVHVIRLVGHCADLPVGGAITLVMVRDQLEGLGEAIAEALRETP